MICQNCNQLAARIRKGLCCTCYTYYIRTGQSRPKHLFKPLILCDNCLCDLSRNRKVGILCVACYEYKRRTGRQRPYRLWNKELLCRNCKKPLQVSARKRGLYCGPCYWYRNKYGIERPKHLYKSGNWCDCGNIASHKKEITISLNLCNACFELEATL